MTQTNTASLISFIFLISFISLKVTRARSGLIVVGDSSTLKNERHWKAFIRWCEVQGCSATQSLSPAVLHRLYSDQSTTTSSPSSLSSSTSFTTSPSSPTTSSSTPSLSNPLVGDSFLPDPSSTPILNKEKDNNEEEDEGER